MKRTRTPATFPAYVALRGAVRGLCARCARRVLRTSIATLTLALTASRKPPRAKKWLRGRHTKCRSWMQRRSISQKTPTPQVRRARAIRGGLLRDLINPPASMIAPHRNPSLDLEVEVVTHRRLRSVDGEHWATVENGKPLCLKDLPA